MVLVPYGINPNFDIVPRTVLARVVIYLAGITIFSSESKVVLDGTSHFLLPIQFSSFDDQQWSPVCDPCSSDQLVNYVSSFSMN
ncbi:hypothetical protein BpHYR1_031286 [Brachionus plicatilis]|uniref:Uncharacterized protein n=1 Tax=Brachionus plicatilis TaxID=10195 RepID=A0A3M7T1Q6_BRAPC|nr:hypothetical protein BpHYR1_031286 [Brachionus plicatilis]